MARIKLKRSSVSGNTPNTSQLDQGELAINTADEKLYSSNGTSVFEVKGNSDDKLPLTGGTVTGTITATDFIGPLNGAIQFIAKNRSGVTINKGQAIYISGITGNTPEIGLADADDASTMPAFGLAGSTATDNNNLEVVTFGSIHGVQTNYTGWALGDTLYISTTAGTLTNVAPSGEAAEIQNIGTVERLHSSNGTIKVGGAGRTNATPNLDDGNVFIGNASNQAVSVDLSTVSLPLAGGTMTGDVSLGDAVKATFGAGDDLQIYHSGTASYIKDTGTGNLIIEASDGVLVRNAAGSNSAWFNGASDASLYYNGVKKLATTSTGIDVTGSVTCDTRVTIDGGTGYASMEIGGDSGGYIDLKAPHSDDYDARLITTGTGLNIDTASGGVTLSHQGSAKLATTSTGVNVTGNVVVSGTVDGRDVATDGAKLDDIATSANNYSHPTTAGNKHIPTGGATGQFLKYSSSGTAVWADVASGGLSFSDLDEVNTVAENIVLGLVNPMSSRTTANYNTGIGEHVLEAATGASYCTVIGYDAGSSTITGQNNTFVGYNAGKGTTSSNNTYMGSRAGANGTSHNSLCIGKQAGEAHTSGTYFHAVGTFAGKNATTGHYNYFSGPNAGALTTTGHTNHYSGYASGYRNTTGWRNTCIGKQAGYNNITGTDNVMLGHKAGYNATGSNLLFISNSDTATPLIGGDFAADTVTINGSLTATDDITAYSDERIKENITEVPNALDAVDAIRGVTYTRTDTKEDSVGVIAQEVEALFPELVTEHEDGIKSVNYNGLIGVLFAAVKELSAEVKTLKESK